MDNQKLSFLYNHYFHINFINPKYHVILFPTLQIYTLFYCCFRHKANFLAIISDREPKMAFILYTTKLYNNTYLFLITTVFRRKTEHNFIYNLLKAFIH